MRKLFVLASALIAACGSSSSPAPSPGPLGGTIAGHPFTMPLELGALRVSTGSTPCELPLDPLHPSSLTPVGVDALAIEVTSATGACGAFSTGTCALKQNSESALVFIAKVNLTGDGVQPTLGAGSYAVSASPAGGTTALGIYTVAYGQGLATFDPSCGGTTYGTSGSGSVRIDSLAGPVTGSMALTFQDPDTLAVKGSLAGTFSAPLCGASLDVCAVAVGAILSGGNLSFCGLPASCAP